MNDYVIETHDLTKQYPLGACVDCLNLHVPKGKIYGLLGQNGAGKTTTMKMLLNLVKPTSGSIFLFGENTAYTSNRIYHRIGSLIETPGFYENLTAQENLSLLARLRGTHRNDTVERALSIVGLENEHQKLFREYSLGMKQRLGIAAAIMHEPEILILDEPVNALDPMGIIEIRNYLLKLCKENGTSILISSHVLSEIEQISDIIGVMKNGRLVKEEDMDKLQKQNRKYVDFQVSDINTAAFILERHFHITDYIITEKNCLRLFEMLEDRADINRCFIENGIAVTGINICEEKLEDYFKKLIGGGENE
ncbi:MAG: ABC transporter ATP-binding protein [Alistipes sp.]|nr:ABC transporter ATP-binding protein [Alistipes sp.]